MRALRLARPIADVVLADMLIKLSRVSTGTSVQQIASTSSDDCLIVILKCHSSVIYDLASNNI